MTLKNTLPATVLGIAVLWCGNRAACQDFLPDPPLPSVLLGDYNDDGKVNAPDYVFWRDFYGRAGVLANEFESIGIIDLADYFVWKINFGNTNEDSSPLKLHLSSAAVSSLGTGGGPVLAIDFVRDLSSRPVLDANGRWQFSVAVIPDSTLFTNRGDDDPDKGSGGGISLEFGLQTNDEHGFANTTVNNLSLEASNQTYENDPNWDGNTVATLGMDNPGVSPYGGLVDREGLDAVGHQIDAFLGTIYFNSDNGGQGFELFTFSAGRPALNSNFGGLTIEIDVDGGYGGFYRLAQLLDKFTPSIYDYPDTDDFFAYTVLAGDVNLDGAVDTMDLAVLDSFLGSPGKWTDGDLTGEGVVDSTDREILLAILVPEPASLQFSSILLTTFVLAPRFAVRCSAMAPFVTIIPKCHERID